MKSIEVMPSSSEVIERAQAELSAKLAEWGIKLIHVMGGPGSGKTAFIQAMIENYPDKSNIAVITADPYSTFDGERFAKSGVQTVQITAPGAVVIDAGMLKTAIEQLELSGIAWLFVENLGTLLIPDNYSLSEHVSILIFSVAEGTEKPVKYTNAFKTANIIFINKIDLIPFTNFDLKHCSKHIHALNQSALMLNGSATRTSTMESIWEHIHRKLETPDLH